MYSGIDYRNARKLDWDEQDSSAREKASGVQKCGWDLYLEQKRKKHHPGGASDTGAESRNEGSVEWRKGLVGDIGRRIQSEAPE